MKRKPDIRKTVYIAVVANIILMICVLLAALYLQNLPVEMSGGANALFIVLSALALICAVVAILFVLSLIDRQNELNQAKASLEQMTLLNNTLRAQRHDYLNHLQVVYGLMELGQYDDANAYMERVYDDIQKVSSVLKTAVPAVNAILQAKVQMCASRDIEAAVDVTTRLEGAAIPDWELCRLLGNIIDNAIKALSEQEGEKRLEIRLFEDIRGFGFEISNNGPEIPAGLRERIFEAGFSSGSHKGDGMGLAICRRILTKYGGELTVASDSRRTAFSGLFPRASAK